MIVRVIDVASGIVLLLLAVALAYSSYLKQNDEIILKQKQKTTSITTHIEVIEEEFDIPEEPDIVLQEVIDQHCIALAIYGEARGETAQGMEWVAWVVKNRSINRNLSYCGVILQHKQFTSFNGKSKLRRLVKEAIDGKITFPRMNNKWVQSKIHEISQNVYYSNEDPTDGATHFWAPKLQAKLQHPTPNWSKRLTLLGDVGNHRFYK